MHSNPSNLLAKPLSGLDLQTASTASESPRQPAPPVSKTNVPAAHRNHYRPLFALGFVLLTLGLSGMPAFSVEKQPPAYPEIRTASGVSRTLQTVSGFNALSGWMANRVLRQELAKHVHGPLHSHLSIYSGTDLLNRKARQVDISGKNIMVEGLAPLSEFEFKSDADTPFYLSKSRRPILLRPVRFNVTATMTENDINTMLQSPSGQKLLTRMKVKLPPFGEQSMDMLNPAVQLEHGRLQLSSLLNMHGAPPENALPVHVSGNITAEKSRLMLSDMDLKIEGINDTEDLEQLIQMYFSELANLNHIKVARHRVQVAIQRSELQNHQLHLQATITVSPDAKALKKALSAANY
jgi:hypothetical protein